jgi:hypothetical protein
MVFLMLVCSAVFIYVFTLRSLAAKERYPPVDCKEVAKYFGTNKSKWVKHAFGSYSRNFKYIADNKKTDFGGSM